MVSPHLHTRSTTLAKVINLKRSAERREHTKRELERLSVPFEFIDAVDGTKLSQEEIARVSTGIWRCGNRTRELFKEEIGCALSHISILKKIVEEKIEITCILEDDNIYDPEFPQIIERLCSADFEWDLFFLGHLHIDRETRSKNKRDIIPGKYRAGEPIEIPLGSYAYLIKYEAAKRILDIIFPIRMPHDYYGGNAPALGIKTYVLSPPCVKNANKFDSLIQDRHHIVYENKELEAKRERVRRLYHRYPFLINLRIWIYKHTCKDYIIGTLRYLRVIRSSYAKLD